MQLHSNTFHFLLLLTAFVVSFPNEHNREDEVSSPCINPALLQTRKDHEQTNRLQLPRKHISFKEYICTTKKEGTYWNEPIVANFITKAIADRGLRARNAKLAQYYFRTSQKYSEEDLIAFHIVWARYCNRNVPLTLFPFDFFLQQYIHEHQYEETDSMDYAEQAYGRNLMNREQAVADVLLHGAINEEGVMNGLHEIWDQYCSSSNVCP